MTLRYISREPSFPTIAQAKGCDSSSMVLLFSLVCAICKGLFLFATVANFLLHSGFRQFEPSSRVVNSTLDSLTLIKFSEQTSIEFDSHKL